MLAIKFALPLLLICHPIVGSNSWLWSILRLQPSSTSALMITVLTSPSCPSATVTLVPDPYPLSPRILLPQYLSKYNPVGLQPSSTPNPPENFRQ